MIRSSGTSPDTKLAQGTYIISLYTAADPLGSSGIQAQAAGIKKATETDSAYVDNLNKIASSTKSLASRLVCLDSK
jgi:hypothetical protein